MIKKCILIFVLCSTIGYGYVLPEKEVKQYQALEKEAKRYYYGDGKKQDFRKARALLMQSCGEGYGCDLLRDISVGITPKSRHLSVPPVVDLAKNAPSRVGYAYLRGMGPLQRVMMQIGAPKAQNVRISMKLYPLFVSKGSRVGAYLVVTDVIQKSNIERYATVFDVVQGINLDNFEGYRAAYSYNTLDGANYSCGLFKDCSNLSEEPNIKWKDEFISSYMEKAPWNQSPDIYALLIRALDYRLGYLSQERGIRWSWQFGFDLDKSFIPLPHFEVTIDRRGNHYEAVYSREHMDNTLFSATYQDGSYEEIRFSEGYE